MKRSQLASQALAAWTLEALRAGEYSLARQELPEIYLPTFFKAFAGIKDLPDRVSLALVGLGTSPDRLKVMARKIGVTCHRPTRRRRMAKQSRTPSHYRGVCPWDGYRCQYSL